jgi:hypothetical protein
MLFIQCAEVQIERHEQTQWKKGLNIMQPGLETFGVADKGKNAKCVTEQWERRFESVIAYKCVWGFIIIISHNTKNHKLDCLEFCRGQDFQGDKILINKR